jgi:protein TonB
VKRLAGIAAAGLAGFAAPAAAQMATPPVPRGSPVSWVTYQDYPAAALRAREQGVVGFRLDVDATGKVTDCTITRSTRSPVLDETSCGLLRRRGRFVPASDAHGQPVAGTWENRFEWQILR